jgi:hypothetical protein
VSSLNGITTHGFDLYLESVRGADAQAPSQEREGSRAVLQNILLKRTVALGKSVHHLCHVLGSPSAKRDDLIGQTTTERS